MAATKEICSKRSDAAIQLPSLLTVIDAADILGASTATIRRMVSRGELKAYTFGKRNLRIDAASVRAALAPVATWTPAQ